MAAGAAIGMAAAGVGGSLVGGLMARKTAKEAMALETQFRNRALAELEKVGIPSREAQRIVLETPEIVFNYVPQLEQEFPELKSAYEQIAVDPRLKEQQAAALAGLEERAEMGLTPEEQAQINALRRETAEGERAAQASILQQMERRGMGGSGAELAARLSASQSAAQGASEEADRLAAMQFAAKQEALSRLLSGAGGVREQEFGEQAKVASARDVLAQLNREQQVGLRQRNIQAQNEAELMRQKLLQQQEEQRAGARNIEEQRRADLIQQEFENRMRKAEAAAGALTGAGAAAGKAGQQMAKSQQQMFTGLGESVAGGFKAYGESQDEDKKKK